MNTRRAVVAALVVAAVAMIWWFRSPDSSPPLPPPTASQGSGAPAPASKPKESTGSSAPSPAVAAQQPAAVQPGQMPGPAASAPVPPPKPARTVYMPPEPEKAPGYADLENTSRMLKYYREMMGENPVGTNAEIMKSLMGGNKKGAMLGPPQGMSLNGSGELMDQWGTPLFFHALSKDNMEIRSAGPDHIMWNADDVVLK